jgi:hypothetical protein
MWYEHFNAYLLNVGFLKIEEDPYVYIKHSTHMFVWPTLGIWFIALGINTMAFNLNCFNFIQSIVDNKGHVINTMVEIINHVNFGMEVVILGLYVNDTILVSNDIFFKQHKIGIVSSF